MANSRELGLVIEQFSSPALFHPLPMISPPIPTPSAPSEAESVDYVKVHEASD